MAPFKCQLLLLTGAIAGVTAVDLVRPVVRRQAKASKYRWSERTPSLPHGHSTEKFPTDSAPSVNVKHGKQPSPVSHDRTQRAQKQSGDRSGLPFEKPSRKRHQSMLMDMNSVGDVRPYRHTNFEVPAGALVTIPVDQAGAAIQAAVAEPVETAASAAAPAAQAPVIAPPSAPLANAPVAVAVPAATPPVVAAPPAQVVPMPVEVADAAPVAADGAPVAPVAAPVAIAPLQPAQTVPIGPVIAAAPAAAPVAPPGAPSTANTMAATAAPVAADGGGPSIAIGLLVPFVVICTACCLFVKWNTYRARLAAQQADGGNPTYWRSARAAKLAVALARKSEDSEEDSITRTNSGSGLRSASSQRDRYSRDRSRDRPSKNSNNSTSMPVDNPVASSITSMPANALSTNPVPSSIDERPVSSPSVPRPASPRAEYLPGQKGYRLTTQPDSVDSGVDV